MNASPFEPMSEQCLLARFDDEKATFGFAQRVRSAKFDWVVDVVQAYVSVAVYFDLDRIAYREVVQALDRLPTATKSTPVQGSLFEIPCCYDFPLDQERIANHVGKSIDEVIVLHTSREYTVYAIGFCPGFPYLGYLPDALVGVPRLETPRLRVEAGYVGLTGRQTGVYTEPRPGGWPLLGRTPLTLVDVQAEFFPLRTGDRVRFVRIDETAYHKLEGRRLQPVGLG